MLQSQKSEIVDPFVAGLRVAFDRDPGLTPAGVAVAAGLDNSTIRKMFENPQRSTRISTATRIAQVLGMTIDDLVSLGAGISRPTVSIAGKVGAGARVPLFDAYEKGDGPQVECPAGLSPHGIVAVEIEGDSMEPAFSAGDLLFYSRNVIGIPDEAIGARCVCEDTEGNAWVKQVRRGSTPGLFNLISLNPSADNQHDVRLKWAAKVRLHWPADLARKVG